MSHDFDPNASCDAFDAACLDVFRFRLRRERVALASPFLLSHFTQHYRSLLTLPRRVRRALVREWKYSLGGVALMIALTPGASLAATLNVAPGANPNVSADGKCSLIEAIFNANTDAALHADCPAGRGADRIVLPVASKQTLVNSVGPLPGTDYTAQGLPKIRSTIVIEGRGSTIERASASPIDLILAIETTGNLTLNDATISGRPPAAGKTGNRVVCVLNRGQLTVTRGSILRGFHDFGYYSDGGAGLHNSGRATLTASTIAFNDKRYGYGGAVFVDQYATLQLNDSVVSNNVAVGAFGYGNSGGGIFSRGTLTLQNTAVVNNRTDFYGGGIHVSAGSLTVRNSVINNNVSSGGGGVFLDWDVGSALIVDTTISGNGADHSGDLARGGGIFAAHTGPLTISNSTISGNSVLGRGGGLYFYGTRLEISHSTVTGNVALTPSFFYRHPIGGGVFISPFSRGVHFLQRSVISGNSAQNLGDEIGTDAEPGLTPSVYANNFNLFGHSGKSGVEGFTPGPTDIVPSVGISSIVMPLAGNGGKGHTHALAIGSPALNAAPLDALCPATDQRGNPRPQGAKCDIGSFEGSAVLCNGSVSTIVGTVNVDTLGGTAGIDVIAGLNGNDTIRGGSGNDVICAGSGSDSVFGGNGNDLLFGDNDNDKLFGEAGNDALVGGSGTDACNGGNNTVAGDSASQCESVTGVP